MYKIKDKIEGNISNERIILNKDINEAKTEKLGKLIEIGILTYEKIRINEIIDSDYDNLCNDILDLDKKIYNNYLKLEEINASKKALECQCGYDKINKIDKFCSECGRKIEIVEEKETITCSLCNSEVDTDSKYCVCCGNKM